MLNFVMTLIIGLVLQAPESPGMAPGGSATAQASGGKQTQSALLDRDTFISNEVGISMALPKESIITSRKAGQTPFFIIRDGSETPAWSLRLESVPSNDPTAEAMIQRLMLSQENEDKSLQILQDEACTVDGVPGHLAWVRETLPDGKAVIFGWLILPQGRLSGQLHYMVGTVITMPHMYEVVQPEMNRAFRSILLRSPGVASGLAQIEADQTTDFLASLTKDKLQSMTDHRTCRRIYRPGQGGEPDQEVAYSIFTLEAAPMGALQPGNMSEMFSPDEKEEGLLVKVHSRIVVDADREIYMDMLGLYWVAWDLSHEAWSAFVTRRQRAATRTEKEFGFRTRQSLGQPRQRLVVIKQDDEINLRQPYEWQIPSPWMPRALTWTLGMFLPRDKSLAMSYAFFDHRQSSPQIGTRRDEWTPLDDQGTRWLLQTWIDDAGLPTRSEYGVKGLIRQTNPDGVVMETTTPENIEQIWSRAGLKTP